VPDAERYFARPRLRVVYDTLAMASKITAINSGKLYLTETGFMKVNDPPNMPGAFPWSPGPGLDGGGGIEVRQIWPQP
jgi:hypothetical protein